MGEKTGFCRAEDCTVRLFQEDGGMVPGVSVCIHRGMSFCAKHAREIEEVDASLGSAILELHAHALVMVSSPSVVLDADYHQALRRVRRLRSMEKNLFGN